MPGTMPLESQLDERRGTQHELRRGPGALEVGERALQAERVGDAVSHRQIIEPQGELAARWERLVCRGDEQLEPDVGGAVAGGRDRDEEAVAGERVDGDLGGQRGAGRGGPGEQLVLAAVAIQPDRLVVAGGHERVQVEPEHLAGRRLELDRGIAGAGRAGRRHQQRAGERGARGGPGVHGAARDPIAAGAGHLAVADRHDRPAPRRAAIVVEVAPVASHAAGRAVELGARVGHARRGARPGHGVGSRVGGPAAMVGAEQRLAAAREHDGAEHHRSPDQNHSSPPRNVGTAVSWSLPPKLTYDSRRTASRGVAR